MATYPRLPSVEVLSKRLKISMDQAHQLRQVMRNEYVKSTKIDDLIQYVFTTGGPVVVGDAVPYCDTFKSVQKWTNQCLHLPNLVERQMCAIDEILGTYGIESIWESDGYVRRKCWNHDYDRHFWGSTVLLYCNTGESYDLTIAYDVREGRFLLTSTGDWSEQNIREVRRNDY